MIPAITCEVHVPNTVSADDGSGRSQRDPADRDAALDVIPPMFGKKVQAELDKLPSRASL